MPYYMCVVACTKYTLYHIRHNGNNIYEHFTGSFVLHVFQMAKPAKRETKCTHTHTHTQDILNNFGGNGI